MRGAVSQILVIEVSYNLHSELAKTVPRFCCVVNY